MTTTLDPPADLASEFAGMTDAQVAALEGSALADLALAELGRRERARQRQHKARHARWGRESEWYDYMHAQYLQAEAETAGVLVNHRGLAREDPLTGDPWPVDGRTLFTGSQWEVDAYASEELLAFWETHPRVTLSEWRRQCQHERQAMRDDAMDEDERDSLRYGARGDAGESAEDRRGDERGGRHAVPRAHPGDHAPQAASGSAGADGGRGAAIRLTEPGETVAVRWPPLPDEDPGLAARAVRVSNENAQAHGLAAARARLQAITDRASARGVHSITKQPPAQSPAPPAASPSAVAVRPAGTVVATRDRREIDGAAVLDRTARYVARFAVLPPGADDIIALWAAHTHVRDAGGRLGFRATPRLLLMSSEPGAGKSRVLEMLGRLCPYTYGLDTEPTAAGLAHTLDKEHATALIDEGDVLFGAGRRKEAVRAIINSGYTRNGTVLRMRGSKAERDRVFGPLAMAGLDVMETATGDKLAALLSRCIIIRMSKARGEVPDLGIEADHAAHLLHRMLAAWTADHVDALADTEPDMPDGVHGRAAQIWAPLIALADVAGGEWPGRARAACEDIVSVGRVIPDEEDTDALAEFDSLTRGWEVA